MNTWKILKMCQASNCLVDFLLSLLSEFDTLSTCLFCLHYYWSPATSTIYAKEKIVALHAAH